MDKMLLSQCSNSTWKKKYTNFVLFEYFYSSRSEMSWPGYSNCGTRLIRHHLHPRVLFQSSCPKFGIIGSGNTLELAMTPGKAASTGTLQWNCMRKGYLNTFSPFKTAHAVCCTVMKAQSVLILCPQGGVINKQQYAQWRERGLAFEMREGVYQSTNPSLLSLRVFHQVGASLFLKMLHNAARV